MQDLPVPIIQTKLYPPPPAPDNVRRERLLSLAQTAAQTPVTLVSAPAGYGKSTLVSQWLQVLDYKSAWLSLDAEESDLTQFLSYLLAALRGACGDCCGDIVDVLQAGILPDTGVLAGMFCNDIESLEGPVMLVLDDYHSISSPEVNDFLDAVFKRPPRNLRLILISRRDPALSLHALRARGSLYDIRMRALAFSEAETSAFVHGQLGKEISADDITLLHQRTEGWPVALRLARLAATSSGPTSSIAARLPEDSHAVRNYLVREVTANQPTAIREYLLRAAFLDRFCAELCEAVNPNSSTGTSGRDFVNHISQANLFLIPLDASNLWFRFHHLFQSMLREQALTDLGDAAIRDLHMRASEWFEEHGFLDAAIRHALSADKADVAADVISRNRNDIMNQEQWHQLGIWLRLLPPQIVASRPELQLLKGRVFRVSGQNEELVQTLDHTEALLDKLDLADGLERELRGSLASQRCYQLYAESDGEGAIRAARQALELLPQVGMAESGFAMLILGVALQMTGDSTGGRSALYSALADKSYQGDDNSTYVTRVKAGLCFVHWMDADLKELKLAAKNLEEQSKPAGLFEALSIALHFKAARHYHRNRLSAVENDLQELLSRKAIASLEFYGQDLIISALTAEALGDSDKALQIADSLRDLALRTQNTFLIGLSEAFAAELAVRQGRIAEALKWAMQYDPEPLVPMYAFFAPQMTLARILVTDDSAASRKRAQALLPRLEDYLSGIHNKTFLIETLALRALLSEKTGEKELAVEQLGQAITLAQPGGFIRVFVDIGPELLAVLNRLELTGEKLEYVGRILAAFGSEADLTGTVQADAKAGVTIRNLAGLPEQLSPREKEVLALLVRRLTNKEIGEQLFISTATVKRHAHSIYEKLNVKGRHEAVTKAVGLGLIAD